MPNAEEVEPNKDVEIPDLPQYQNVSYAVGVNGSSMEPTFHDGDISLDESARTMGRAIDKLYK